MIPDNLLRLQDNVAVTSTALSSNVIDLSVIRDIGEGFDLYCTASVTQAFVPAGVTNSLRIRLLAGNTATPAGGDPVVDTEIGNSGFHLAADLVLGAKIVFAVNPQALPKSLAAIGAPAYSTLATGTRYLYAEIVVVDGPFSAGKLTIDLTLETTKGTNGNKIYPGRFVVQ